MQRGTQELKKYLLSRIEEPTAAPVTSVVESRGGQSGVFGASTTTVDPHSVAASKSLDYRFSIFHVCSFCLVFLAVYEKHLSNENQSFQREIYTIGIFAKLGYNVMVAEMSLFVYIWLYSLYFSLQ